MQSPTIAELAKAYSAFQASDLGAKKNANNPAFKNKYADLGSIWDVVREPLAAHGLSVVQQPMPSERGELRLRTTVMHVSGEWIASEIAMPLGKVDPQGYGSAITYARRYALAAMLGVTQEDDDGHAAAKQTQAGPAEPAATRAQIDNIGAEMKRIGMTPEAGKTWLASTFGKQSRLELTEREAAQMLSHLKTQPPAAQTA